MKIDSKHIKIIWLSYLLIMSVPDDCKNVPLSRWFMVFYATFNNISVISWRSVLLVEETGVNHQLAASH
jgi:hypothetical protein